MILRIPLLLSLAVFPWSDVRAHEGHLQAATEAVFPSERLSPPDLPVTDRFGTTDGFINRFGSAGTVVISFTYANCATVCPLANAILAEVQDELTAGGVAMITLSIDPARDTPAVMSAAAGHFGTSPSWHWVAASVGDTPALLAAFGVPFGPPEEHLPTILIGDLATGEFVRVVGLPDPEGLLTVVQARADEAPAG